MSKIAVVYWSGTGNTEKMATAVAEGIREKGAEAVLMRSAQFDASKMDAYDGIAFGCPSMGRKNWRTVSLHQCLNPANRSF